MVEDYLIVRGVFAGQRRGVFIVDAPSHDEIVNILSGLPFWDRMDGSWTVRAIFDWRMKENED
jgi:YCII-related domain